MFKIQKRLETDLTKVILFLISERILEHRKKPNYIK